MDWHFERNRIDQASKRRTTIDKMKYTLTQNTNYEAAISLSWMEGTMASNEMIAAKLREAGFEKVRVEGTGQKRKASGTWAKPSEVNVEIPKQVSEIRAV